MILALGEAKASGDEGQAAARRAVEALARAMGIIPSSEKAHAPKRNSKVETPLDPDVACLIDQEKRLKELQRYVSRKLKAVQKTIAEGMKIRGAEPEEPEANGKSTELILSGGSESNLGTEDGSATVDDEARNNMGERRIETEVRREKTDLVFDHKSKVIHGEKIFDPDTGRTLAMDLSLLGPPGKRITWRALANIIMMIFGMAIPAARIEKLLGTKGFSRSNLSDYCAYVAERLLPVYIAMAEAIARCEVVMGDDCVSRVSDLTRYRRDLKIWKADKKKANDEKKFLEENPKPLAPWEKLGEKSLTSQLETSLDFSFVHHKSNDGAPKIRLHTSLLSGETVCGNPETRIVIYRSHLGSVGNLLSRVLLGRKTTDGPLVFVGDLSSSNHVNDPEVLKRVAITYAGCVSHARRGFKRFYAHDPDECEVALDLFRGIFHLEEIQKGASDKLKLSIRAEQSMWCWNELKSHGLEMQQKWSPSSALGETAQYLLSNFKSFTYYCTDVRIPPSNDLSERLLRYEKLMDRSSFGRETIEGRARYDIVRSFWQTCVSARINPVFALIDVLIAPEKEVLANPEQYIPQAILKRHKSDPERQSLIDKILHTKDFVSLVSYKLRDPGMPLDDNDD